MEKKNDEPIKITGGKPLNLAWIVEYYETFHGYTKEQWADLFEICAPKIKGDSLNSMYGSLVVFGTGSMDEDNKKWKELFIDSGKYKTFNDIWDDKKEENKEES